jgi:hypothetical protein
MLDDHDWYIVTEEPLRLETIVGQVSHPTCGAVNTFLGAVREFTGDQRTASANVRYRFSANLAASATMSRSIVRLPEGSFTADLLGWRLNYAYSTSLFASAYVQYNTAADQRVTSLRINYIHAPLSDLFLVLRERRDTDTGEVLERVLSAKLTRTLSF